MGAPAHPCWLLISLVCLFGIGASAQSTVSESPTSAAVSLGPASGSTTACQQFLSSQMLFGAKITSLDQVVLTGLTTQCIANYSVYLTMTGLPSTFNSVPAALIFSLPGSGAGGSCTAVVNSGPTDGTLTFADGNPLLEDVLCPAKPASISNNGSYAAQGALTGGGASCSGTAPRAPFSVFAGLDYAAISICVSTASIDNGAELRGTGRQMCGLLISSQTHALRLTRQRRSSRSTPPRPPEQPRYRSPL